MRSRLRIPWVTQYYSNHSGKLLQSHPEITPGSVEKGWEFVEDERTCQPGKCVRQLITPIRFEITPILVEKHWQSLENLRTMWLALTFLQLKYTIIQLQEWRNVKLLQSDFTENTKKWRILLGGGGKGSFQNK